MPKRIAILLSFSLFTAFLPPIVAAEPSQATESAAAAGQSSAVEPSVAPVRPMLAVGYYGERISNPGLTADLELPIVGGGISALSCVVRLGGALSLRNDVSAFADVSLLYRMTFGFGLFWDISVGAGILWIVPLYIEYSDDAAPAEIPQTGRPYGSVPIGLGVGWDFSRNDLLPISAFFRLELAGRYPDYGTIVADPVTAEPWMAERMAINENYLIDLYAGKYENIERRIDTSDGVQPFEALLLFEIWKASPAGVDSTVLKNALNSVCAAYPGYARVFLARAEYLFSKGYYTGCFADAAAALLCNPLSPLQKMRAYGFEAKAKSASGNAAGAKAAAVSWLAVFDSLAADYALTASDAKARDEMAKY